VARRICSSLALPAPRTPVCAGPLIGAAFATAAGPFAKFMASEARGTALLGASLAEEPAESPSTSPNAHPRRLGLDTVLRLHDTTRRGILSCMGGRVLAASVLSPLPAPWIRRRPCVSLSQVCSSLITCSPDAAPQADPPSCQRRDDPGAGSNAGTAHLKRSLPPALKHRSVNPAFSARSRRGSTQPGQTALL
jgi:hypothetical protein